MVIIPRRFAFFHLLPSSFLPFRCTFSFLFVSFLLYTLPSFAQVAGTPIMRDDFGLRETFAENWAPNPKSLISVNGKVNFPGGGALQLNRSLPPEFYAVIHVRLNKKAKQGFCGLRIGKRHFMIHANGDTGVLSPHSSVNVVGKYKQIDSFTQGNTISLTLIRTIDKNVAHYRFNVEGQHAGEFFEPLSLGLHGHGKDANLQLFCWLLDVDMDDFSLSGVKMDRDESPNMQPNSSFEHLDSDGFPLYWRRSGFDFAMASQVAYRDYLATMVVDDRVAHSGKRSLKLIRNHAATPLNIWGTGVPTIRGAMVCFSLYMKADREDLPVIVRIEGMLESPLTVRVGTKWKRYEVIGNLARSVSGHAGGIIRVEKHGTVWIDDVQSEIISDYQPGRQKSYATPYSPSPRDTELFAPPGKEPAQTATLLIPYLKNNTPLNNDWLSNQKNFLQINRLYHAHKAPTNKTHIYLACDDDNLYLAYRCFSPKTAEIARKTKKPQRDSGPIFMQDSVEFFLDPRADGIFHQMLVQAANCQLDIGRNHEKAWNGDWNSRTVVHENLNCIDYFITLPFSDFACAEMKSQWLVNFCRNDLTLPQKEYLSIVKTPTPNFQNTKYWNKAVFPENVVRKYSVGVTRAVVAQSGEGQSLQVEIENNTGQKLPATIRILNVQGRHPILPETTRDLDGGQTLLNYQTKNLHGKIIVDILVAGRKRASQIVTLKEESLLTMRGRLNYYMREKQAQFRIRNRISAKGEVKARLTLGKLTQTAQASPLFTMSLPLDTVPAGRHQVRLELWQQGRKLGETSAELVKRPYWEGATQINHFTRSLHRKGRNILLLTPYFSITPRFTSNDYAAGIPLYLKQHGFRQVHVLYSSPHLPEGTPQVEIDRGRSFLLNCQKQGIDVFIWNNYYWKNGPKLVPFPAKVLKKTLSQLNTTNILAQMILDEPDLEFDTNSARDFVHTMQQVFPYTPVLINNTILGIPARFASLAGDALMLDYYIASAENITVKALIQHADTMLNAAAEKGQPGFFFVEANNAVHYREITYEEQIAQTYGCIASGCTGISWYLGNASTPGDWNAIVQANRELLALNDVILSEEAPIDVKASVNASRFRHLDRRHRGAAYVVSCNIDNSNLGRVTLRLPKGLKTADTVEVMFENRSLPILNGSFSDTFKRYERHVYRIALRP